MFLRSRMVCVRIIAEDSMGCHFHPDLFALEKIVLRGMVRYHGDVDLRWAKNGRCFGRMDQEFRDYFFGNSVGSSSFSELTSARSWVCSSALDVLVKKQGLKYYCVRCSEKYPDQLTRVFEPQLILVGVMRSQHDAEWSRRSKACDESASHFLRAISDELREEYKLGFFGDGVQGRFAGKIWQDKYFLVNTPSLRQEWRVRDLDGFSPETVQYLAARHDVFFTTNMTVRAELCEKYAALMTAWHKLQQGEVADVVFSKLRDDVLECWVREDRLAAQYVIDWIKQGKERVAIQTCPFYSLPLRVFEEEAVKNGLDYAALVPVVE